MIEIDTNLVTNIGISAQDVTNYAISKGWQLVEHPNPALSLFLGIPDDTGEPIHLFIPRHTNYIDAPLRLAEAVQLLADVEDRSLVDVLTDIKALSKLDSNI